MVKREASTEIIARASNLKDTPLEPERWQKEAQEVIGPIKLRSNQRPNIEEHED